MKTKTFTLSDSAIAKILKVIQNGLLTSSDVTNSLREIQVKESDLKQNELLDVAVGKNLSDLVLRRIVQAVQESFMTGTDFTDHMRMMRLKVDVNDENMMTLTEEYMQMVRRNLETQVEDGKKLYSNRKEVQDDSHIVLGEE